MPPPNKSTKPSQGSNEPGTPSNNLWVGNLSLDVTDSDLKTLFEKYGSLDSISSYPSRSYAFLYFKRAEDAKAARDALQGTDLRGSAIKIDFAKPAKPCKSLWVGGIGPSVSKEKLEKEFLKFGTIQEFRFLGDRNTAFVDYLKLEDASQALKSMNGKRIGDQQIRVDFVRSQPMRREHGSDFRDAREGQFLSIGPDSPWMPQDFMRNYSEPTHSGSRRQQNFQSSGGRKGDGQPSKVLWISYPPSVHIDEQMLHNAMILFGEIESIRSFSTRNYSFVVFRSVEEARRAKEGLQGKLFNDPRISIEFSSSDLAPGKDFSGFYPGIKGPRPDNFFSEVSFRPPMVDVFAHNRPIVPNTFPGYLPSRGIRGPDMLMRPLGSQGSFEHALPAPEFGDLATLHKLQGADPNILMGGANWRRSSPAPSMKPPITPAAGGWDVFDTSQFQRESKRSRIDDALTTSNVLSLQRMDDRSLEMDQLSGLSAVGVSSGSGSLSNIHGRNRASPINAGVRAGGTGQGHPDNDHVWRGIIAKGGTTVCCARCVPIGEGIGSKIPDTVNCSARTGLDMLAKHYADAVGFGIVFFLPDSVEDFASYTEFLRYLGANNRAGVAKLVDGTNLFLVPPSDFLSKVLDIDGPERLYGVVLKFPQHIPDDTSMQTQSLQPQYVDRQQISSSRTEYGVMPHDERVLQINYDRAPHEDLKLPQKPLGSATNDSSRVHSVPPTNTTALSQAGVTLTPELIATLASLLPANGKLLGSESAQPQLGSSTLRHFLTPASAPEEGISLGLKHEHQVLGQTGHSGQQLVSQYNPQAQALQPFQAYPAVSNTSSFPAQGVTCNTQFQDSTVNSQQGAVSSKPSSNFAIPSQSGQFSIMPQNQHYQLGIPQDAQKGLGMSNGMDDFKLYVSSVQQPPTNSVALSNEFHGANDSHHRTVTPMASETVNSELTNQVQQLQSVLYDAGQGTSEVEVDKNERYRSTLQFAANLLLKIQQQQHGTPGGQGSGNQ